MACWSVITSCLRLVSKCDGTRLDDLLIPISRRSYRTAGAARGISVISTTAGSGDQVYWIGGTAVMERKNGVVPLVRLSYGPVGWRASGGAAVRRLPRCHLSPAHPAAGENPVHCRHCLRCVISSFAALIHSLSTELGVQELRCYGCTHSDTISFRLKFRCNYSLWRF